MAPGVVLISSVAPSDRIVILGEYGVTRLLQSLSKVDFSYSHSHALAYKSSRLMITAGSDFHSRGVVCISNTGWWDVICRSLIQ